MDRRGTTDDRRRTTDDSLSDRVSHSIHALLLQNPLHYATPPQTAQSISPLAHRPSSVVRRPSSLVGAGLILAADTRAPPALRAGATGTVTRARSGLPGP